MTDLPFDKFLNLFKKKVDLQESNEYVELEVDQKSKPTTKLYVKYYSLVKFEDASSVLNDIRSGSTLSFIKVKDIREKGGLDELKRTISKMKRSADAAEAQIVGIDEDYILVVPNFVNVSKGDILAPKSEA
ncbi:MAG: cell division protein SepF [Candidatus Parvarchaeota archaeon]|nr:cell division protein SepF [Candidatus Parvarchaeota archaeon]